MRIEWLITPMSPEKIITGCERYLNTVLAPLCEVFPGLVLE
jgi:hypothetical protein